MKKKLLLAISSLLLIQFSIISQAPQAFNYQGIARDAGGIPLIEQDIKVRASIITGTLNGNVVYVEVHTMTTNVFGLFTLAIGGGVVESGIFATIPWAEGNTFLQIELDPTGGTDYVLSGTTQLLSVPYALYAESSGISDELENRIATLEETVRGSIDADNDGFTPLQGDCDDDNPFINPNAVDICGDGMDNNCNGFTDSEDDNCATNDLPSPLPIENAVYTGSLRVATANGGTADNDNIDFIVPADKNVSITITYDNGEVDGRQNQIRDFVLRTNSLGANVAGGGTFPQPSSRIFRPRMGNVLGSTTSLFIQSGLFFTEFDPEFFQDGDFYSFRLPLFALESLVEGKKFDYTLEVEFTDAF